VTQMPPSCCMTCVIWSSGDKHLQTDAQLPMLHIVTTCPPPCPHTHFPCQHTMWFTLNMLQALLVGPEVKLIPCF
jgi:hypothetical protein